MFCALSGEAPQVPVLSRISGNVFERRLLETYVAENNKDPTNGEDMVVEDIVEIKTSRFVRPRPPNATSIPSLLSIFQNEWDALAMETYQVKQQLYQTRQELSTALYQHDAACRVIARITKERDEARDALSKVSQNINGTDGTQAMETDIAEMIIPDSIQQVVESTLQQESAGRKKRKVPEGWTTAEQLSGLKSHKGKKAELKLLASAVAVSGGSLSATHPSGQFSVLAQGTEWTLRGEQDQELAISSNVAPISAVAIHPDGHLVALGSVDGNVYIFHLLTSKVEAVFGPVEGPISSVTFAENGFWLAVVAENEAKIKIWHLAKASVAAELEVPIGTKSAAWDHSAQFLACAGLAGLKIWAYTKSGKNWSVAFEATESGDHDRIAWQPEAQGLVLDGKSGGVVFSL